MSDQLMKKLMLLFEQCFASAATPQTADTTLTETNELFYLEKNTFFVREASLKSMRILSTYERSKLSARSIRFIEYLLQLDIIGDRTRELIFNQLTLTDEDNISLQEVKWTILHTLSDSLAPRELAFLTMVLLNNPKGQPLH